MYRIKLDVWGEGVYMKSASELVVLAGVGVRGVVLLALERVDDLIVVVARPVWKSTSELGCSSPEI